MERITWQNLVNRFTWLKSVAKERGIPSEDWELLQLASKHYALCSNKTGLSYSRHWTSKREAYEGMEDMVQGLMLIST